ncbi:phage holin family protein [Methylocapsa palsarum]|jgi:uncharacterized membrane protein YqjE|uniref:Putative Holin-X, holin superfamily III n=1 Tax=Methylocapsa palsarum TaxID=1612308 RepID=A0A1I3XEX0_9HYPH|nr:phage holin family protein [Methylocapsa palsarum]SFK18087.1 Putative Holin-X, holin superfamily III [Methylocapsa palsarum]
MDERVRRPSTPELFVEVATHAADLVQSEFRLARSEVREMVDKLIRIVASFVVSAVLMAVALFLLLQALVDWLVVLKFRADFAELAVGLGAALIGGAVFSAAWRAGKAVTLAPERTIRQVVKDANVVKGQLS